LVDRVAGPLIWILVHVVQGVLLIVLGAVGLIALTVPPEDQQVVLFELNPAHALLLLVTGVLAVVSAWTLRTIRWFAAAELAVFLVLFLYGTAQSTANESSTIFSLDPPENFLHAALALLGFIVLCGAYVVPRSASRRRLITTMHRPGAHEAGSGDDQTSR
jgi:hypothetical protein